MNATAVSTRSAFLAGKIVDPQGKAVPEAVVLLTAPGAAAEPTRRTVTDQRGWFRVDNLLTGQRYLVVVTAFQGTQTLLARASVVAPKDRILITLHPAGQATSEQHRPVSGPTRPEQATPTNTAPSRWFDSQFADSRATSPAPVASSTERQLPEEPDAGAPRAVTDGVSLRQFIGRLFGRRDAEQPPLQVQRPPQRNDAGQRRTSGPARPFAELPVPGRPPNKWQSSVPPIESTPPETRRLDLADERGDVERSAAVWRPVRRSGSAVQQQRRNNAVVHSSQGSTLRTTVVKTTPGTPRVQAAGFFSRQAPEVTALRLPGMDLRPVDLGQLDGELLLVDFWASWCGACLRAMPEIERLHRDYGSRGLRVLGVAYEQGEPDHQAARVRAVASRLQITYPLVLGSEDRTDALRQSFHVRVLPTLVLLDRNGNVLWRGDGFDPHEFSRLRAIVHQRLSDSG